jgi:transposase
MEKKGRRRYSLGWKEQILARIAAGEGMGDLRRELGISKTLLYSWRKEWLNRGEEPGRAERKKLQRDGEIQALEARIAELEAAVGRKSLEVDFLESALRRFGVEPSSRAVGEKRSGPKSAGGSDRKAG